MSVCEYICVLQAFPPTCFGLMEHEDWRKRVLCGVRMPLKVLCSLDAHSGRTDGLSWLTDKPLATWVFHMLRVGSKSRPGSPDWSPGFSGRDEL